VQFCTLLQVQASYMDTTGTYIALQPLYIYIKLHNVPVQSRKVQFCPLLQQAIQRQQESNSFITSLHLQ
jgi:hypothetical protein